MNKLFFAVAWLVFFASWFSFTSCVHDNLEDLTKPDSTSNAVCDTAFTVSYVNDIAPLIKSQCPLCHTEAYYTFDGGDIRMDAWEYVKLKADDGSLICAINHGNDCEPMPKDEDKLNDCQILRITAWVNQGAQNN